MGPLSPALIRISPSASDPCSRTCVVTLWCNRLHLTGTVHCWRTPSCLWSTDVDIATLMTPRLLHQWVFTTVYELRQNFVTLANINCCVSSRARGAAWLRGQLSTIRIRVPNRGSIRPNTNSPFGPLFGPVQIRIEYSVQPYYLQHLATGSTLMAVWPFSVAGCSLELSSRFHPGPDHPCRLFQMFA